MGATVQVTPEAAPGSLAWPSGTVNAAFATP